MNKFGIISVIVGILALFTVNFGLAPASGVAAQGPQAVIYHPRNLRVDREDMWELDEADINAIGGAVVSGQPRAFVLVDYASGPITAGVFEVTRGVVQITFPFTEHATVLSGLIVSTNLDTGETQRLRPGDSYVIEAGTTVLWDVRTPRMQKSFMHVAPAP